MVGLEKRRVGVVVLAQDDEEFEGLSSAAVTAMDRLLTSLSLPAMMPDASSMPAWRSVSPSVPSPVMDWSASAAPGSMMVRW
jgi:hypothetical protein